MKSLGPTAVVSHPRERWVVVVVAVLAALGVFWPLPLHLTDGLVTSSVGEGPQHVWRWWVAGQIDWPWGGQFDGANFPDGLWVHVVDPLHALVAGGLGWWWGGPAGGHAVVQVLGIVVSALAGHLLAEETGADRAGRILGTAAGLAIPTVVGAGLDGITEGLGLGWVALQLGVLLRLIRTRRRGDVAWLALALGCAAWSGPYNLVFAAFVDVVVAGAALRRTRLPLVAGGLGLVLSSPIIWASLSLGDAGPGGAARATMERPEMVEAWRGAWREGTDLLDLVLPVWMTGDAAMAPSTGYLGLFWIGLVVAGTLRAARGGQLRAIVPWLAGGVFFAVVALGPFLVLEGELLRVGTFELWGPAAFLESVPVLGRLSRWYRAAAVAVLLWVPVAAVAVRGRALTTALGLGLLVVLDARLGSPVPFPASVVPVIEVDTQAWSGSIAELPAIHPMGMPGVLADRNLLLQTTHGAPSSAPVDALFGVATRHVGLKILENVIRFDAPDNGARIESARQQLVRSGYQNLVLYPAMLPEGAVERLSSALGPATEVAPEMWLIVLER